jgi:hypothetical protein
MNATPLPELPASPIWRVLVFESPILGPVLCAIVALLLFLILRNAGKPKPAFMSAAMLLAAAIGVGVTSSTVETQREIAIRLTNELIDRVFVGDVNAVDSLVADGLVVSASGSTIGRDYKPWMLNAVSVVPDWLESGSFTIEDAGIDNASTTRVLARVSIEPNYTAGSSVWMFTWRQESSGDWKLYGFEALRWGLRDADASALRRGRP